MAGGSLTFTTDNYAQLSSVAQRVLCQVAAANVRLVQLTSAGSGGSGWGVTLPEAAIPASLVLRRAGTNYGTGGTYVASTNMVVNAGNGQSMLQNVNTCPASTNQPTVSAFVTNVGGNPLATTLTYANVAAAGTVNIAWGDGTFTNGAAESGSSNHTYANPGDYTITVTDASVGTDLGQTYVKVPLTS